MDKKGQVGNIPQYVISFVLIGLIVAVGLVVLDFGFKSNIFADKRNLWAFPVLAQAQLPPLTTR